MTRLTVDIDDVINSEIESNTASYSLTRLTATSCDGLILQECDVLAFDRMAVTPSFDVSWSCRHGIAHITVSTQPADYRYKRTPLRHWCGPRAPFPWRAEHRISVLQYVLAVEGEWGEGGGQSCH